jgi:hypothetical protein
MIESGLRVELMRNADFKAEGLAIGCIHEAGRKPGD